MKSIFNAPRFNAPRTWLAVFSVLAAAMVSLAQPTNSVPATFQEIIVEQTSEGIEKQLVMSVLPAYYSRIEGVSLRELLRRALTTNQELAAARLGIDKARARLTQARSRPNPTLEFEQTSGRLVGNGGDREFAIGASLPIEIYGRRSARIAFAQIEIDANEAEVRNRERILTANILNTYSDALGALREIEMLEKVLELDMQTTRFVQIRVNEGDAAPLELNLLTAEVERLRSRRQLAEGRLQSSLIGLKMLVGIGLDEALRLREEISSAILPTLPKTREEAIDIALRSRPDAILARIEEDGAAAGLRIIRSNSKPDLTASTRYQQGRSLVDTPNGIFPQRDRSITIGASVGIPLFNRNEGAIAEAEISIQQAKNRREYTYRTVRSEILSAYQRYEAASRAVLTLQNSAIPRSTQNVDTFRRMYEIGEIKITDLIAEQRRLLDTNGDLTEALTQKYRAQADLHISIGAEVLLP